MIPRKENKDTDMEINFDDKFVIADEVGLLKTKRALLKKLAVRFGGAHREPPKMSTEVPDRSMRLFLKP